MRTIYQKKMIYIGILVIIIGVLTVGFATFSNTLNISSQTIVSPNFNNFQITISGKESDPTFTNTMAITNTNGTSVSHSGITNYGNRSVISQIHITFTRPGQMVKFFFYAHNTGLIDGYFKGNRFNSIPGTNQFIKCTAGEGTTDTLVQETCKKIEVIPSYLFQDTWNTSTTLDKRVIIKKGSVLPLALLFQYSDNSTTRADGPFDVEIGDIEFVFSTN